MTQLPVQYKSQLKRMSNQLKKGLHELLIDIIKTEILKVENNWQKICTLPQMNSMASIYRGNAMLQKNWIMMDQSFFISKVVFNT